MRTSQEYRDKAEELLVLSALKCDVKTRDTLIELADFYIRQAEKQDHVAESLNRIQESWVRLNT